MGLVRVRLLGAPEVRGERRAVALERRTAVLVAYLALEGPTPRLRLASRLWPEVSDRTCQANLRQLLRRLRVSTGMDLIEGRTLLRLASGVTCDVHERAKHLAEGRLEAAVAYDGMLLEDCDLDGCVAMESWLRHRRELSALELGRAYAALVDHAESERDFPLGILLAERWLARDPTSELAHRKIISLALAQGDRATARAWAEHYAASRNGSDANGDEARRMLEDMIHEPSRGPRTRAPELPLATLRPPRLVGREREWERMEGAFERGEFVLVIGEPGVGKSRLLFEFAAAHGRYDVVFCRPGDAEVPYATFARHVRRRADRIDSLPGWVRRETSRIVPELFEPPLALESVFSSRTREALLRTFEACTKGFDALVTDDAQFIDRGTFDIGQSVLAEMEAGRRDLPRFLDACRSDELPFDTDVQVRRLESLGLATRIVLPPLEAAAVRRMIRDMDLPGSSRLVDELVDYVGGHPLFLVETLRHLIETDALRPGFSARMPGGGRVRGLLEARLGRLSERALALARVAAVLGEGFTPERAAAALDCDLMALCEPFVELARAQLHDGTRFHYDLVAEVVRAGVVPAMASAIRRRAGDVTEPPSASTPAAR